MTKKRRILQIIPTLDRCGAEKQMTLLATNLPRDEFEVEVLVLTRTGPLENDLLEAGIKTTLINKRLKLDPFAYSRLKQEIKRFQPDLVHTWLFAANTYGRRAALRCGVKRIVAGERCVDPWKTRYHFMIDRYLAAKTDRIVTNSEGVKEFYIRNGIPADRFQIIPNAVLPPPALTPLTVDEMLADMDLRRIEPTGDYHPVVNPQYDPERETYIPIAPEALSRQKPFLIGVVARLWPQKRIDDLLWVFESLKFVKLNYHAMIIGDGPLRETLLRFRDEWKLRDRVHFLGQRNDVPQLMPAFDLLLNASAYEGQSNSILEAMSLGIPVIATDIPGNRDLVLDGQTGLLVPDCGEDFRKRRRTFVEKILGLLENEALREQMKLNAIARVQEQFSLEKMIENHVELYRKLIDSSD